MMKKRWCGALLALLLVLTLLPTAAFAANGADTAADPILIGSAEELKAFRDRVNNGEGSLCAELTADIVLNDGTFDENGNWSESGTPEQWTPIGNFFGDGYSGTFDGGGHTIKGLYVTGQQYAGLFGYTENATIQNVTVDGYVEGYAQGDKRFVSYAGGIVGCQRGGKINNCRNNGAVHSSVSSAGGIAGYLLSGTVNDCCNTGTVSSSLDGSPNTGGIIGWLINSTVNDCCNTGTVTALRTSGNVGDTGGIIGCLINSTVNNCYNTGTVTNHSVSGATSGGGIAGQQSNGEVKNCYYLTDTAENAVGKFKEDTIPSNVAVKTRSDFANGDVLALLKQNDTTNAWADECGYLAAAGMTLPLLSWQQVDAHDHDGNWEFDTTDHWKECSCGKLIKAAHSGGAATCHDKAKCEACGKEYGALNPNHHASLTHIDAVAATTSDEGNIEYWHCTGCDKYYADATATQPIAQADTVIAKLPSGTSRPSRPSVADSAAKDIRNAKSGETVRIDMKGETKLPASVLDAAYGKDITLEIDMGNGAVWTISGLDIPKGGVSLNLGVRTGVTTIPVKVINAITGEVSTVQFQLSHSGAFGLPLTLSLELGKAFDGMFANLYYYDETAGKLDFQCSGKIRGGTASWPFTHASAYVVVIDETDHDPMRFVDVADGAYYYDAVLWAAQKGITSGTDAVHFSPNQPCTRAEIVTFLWRAAGSPVVNYAMDMADVPEGSYYAEAVRWALSLGITTGTGAAAFSPDAPCTRAQAVTFLARARNAKASGGMAVREFEDFDRIPAYAVDAIQWALENHVTTGTSDTAFSPDEVCTRAQIVTFLWRAFQ